MPRVERGSKHEAFSESIAANKMTHLLRLPGPLVPAVPSMRTSAGGPALTA